MCFELGQIDEKHAREIKEERDRFESFEKKVRSIWMFVTRRYGETPNMRECRGRAGSLYDDLPARISRRGRGHCGCVWQHGLQQSLAGGMG